MEEDDQGPHSPTNPGIGGPDPAMAQYHTDLALWVGLRDSKQGGIELTVKVMGLRPIRPDITVSEAAREWDWLADQVGPEKASKKLGNRPRAEDYPGHDQQVPHRLPTTVQKAAGQNSSQTDTVEDSPKEYRPKSQDVLDALVDTQAEGDATRSVEELAEEANDLVEGLFAAFEDAPFTPSPAPSGAIDDTDEGYFGSFVVRAAQAVPSKTKADDEDLAALDAAQRKFPPPSNVPTDMTDPPPAEVVEETEATPPDLRPAVTTSRSRRSIVTTICYGLGVIGVLAVGGALFVTRKPPTPIVVRPTVCMSPDLRRNLPTEAQSHYFPCHRGGPPMFYCSVNAAPTKEERPQFCRTIWAACAPPIGHSVSASEQEACLADPYAHPINH